MIIAKQFFSAQEKLRKKIPGSMRLCLTVILMLLAQISVQAGSQSRITLKLKNVELTKAISLLEQQSEYRFVYNNNLMPESKKVDANFREAELPEVMNTMLDGTGLSYRMMKEDLVVLYKPTPGEMNADIRLTGRVTDENGNPLVGASINVKGTNNGTSTGANGAYSLTVPDNAVIVVSYVGYESREIAVGGRNEISVQLQPAVRTGEQVVVVGYGTQRKRDLTGSVASVNGNDIARQPNNNPISSLQGKVSGVTIVNSGAAGSSPTVRIRGLNSTNNGDPLYVVDGIFQTSIDYLSPGDIESIEVLKDPSSIAIFGLQGGNGVILVTTKRAKKGQTRVNFQSQVGVQKVNNKIDLVDAAGFKKLYSAQLVNLNAAPFDFTNYKGDTHWQDEIFRTAFFNNNSLSISNTGEKTSTVLNVSYNTQEGVLRNDKFEKLIIRLNEEIRLNKALRVGADLTTFYYNSNPPAASILGALWAAPIVPIKAADGLYYSMPSFQRAQVGNPVAQLDRFDRTNVNKGYRATGSVFAELKFLQNFTWKSTFYADIAFNGSRSYTPLPFRFINLGENTNATDTTFDRSIRTGIAQSQATYRNFQQDHILTFDKVINTDHRLGITAGFTTLYRDLVNISGNRSDTSLVIPNNPSYWYLDIASANNPGNYGGAGNQEAYMSVLGRVNYAFKNKYLLNASYRRDGNSKYAVSRRWNNFGSVGVGWVVSEEDFFKGVKGLDFLKLRASYGTVGNGLGIAGSRFASVIAANVGIFGNNVYPSIAPAFVPDENLHAEVVKGTDLGLELRTLQNRLSFELTFYQRKTEDILTFITLPGTNLSKFTNAGTIENKGVELSLGFNDKIGRDFSYRISANGSYNKNKVVSIGEGINFQLVGNGGVNLTTSGESIGYFYGYKQVGIYQNTADLDKMPHFVNSLPGDIAYEDVNKDGKLDTKDRTYLGSPLPKWNFGGNVTLNYKMVDFGVDLQGVAGNKIYTQRRTATFAVLNYETNRLNAWTGAGSTNIEPILDNSRANNFLFSNYFLEKGDYFRIRNVQLGYTLGSAKFKKMGIETLRLSVSAQNLATFSYATGYSPEVPIGSPIAGGADNGSYPVPTTYSFGVNVIF
ncbi:MAG: TonB-linked outer membrane protein SusC/RagA family [Ferruginibacter sp.]|nr:TonB-linked outer membrane protein SusC/RagA family [Ferruginibacter sp.]